MSCVKEIDLKALIQFALKEDIGSGDITSEAFIPKNKFVKAVLLAKEPCIICGLHVAQTAFNTLDKTIHFKPLIKDGAKVKKDKVIARIEGNARSILSAERVALNFLAHLSGIATLTRKFVEAVKPAYVKIIDTRKTIPGLRLLQKYAVRCGGGYNHRFSLDEMLMIKDNHLKIIKSYGFLRLKPGNKRKKLECEVTSLKEFKEALELQPDIIMLDNMTLKKMRSAVLTNRKSAHPIILEASGGINLKNIKKVASSGINLISIGALTHSAPSSDISLEIK
ncbi:MAG: carboxylating nicotinate-nucleotide diphosphorylase [Candidatus Omnitrophica bacterium]|jgi:nicotinate-nucleotide pyrophosphorylase (carboxylating)|nr:carboxylating nicotinate-nucleotide diphosphorylase [Candidatus Omnitrophota bacterium]